MLAKNDQINELVTRGIEGVIPSRGALEKILRSGKKITVYLGVDPTTPKLHLGHSVTLLLLARFQKLGHKVVLLIGDFTAQIGDPSGKTNQRRPLSAAEVKQNWKTYRAQAGKILDFRTAGNRATVAYNSTWHSKLHLKDVLELGSLFTVQQMLARDMFQVRIKENKPIGLNEFLYPLIQGYDSVALKTDAEIGGSDQLFNMLVGRDLVKRMLKKEKFVLTTKLLVDPTSGAKMSKSEGQLVALDDPAGEMYAKIMAFPDEMIWDCFELCTEVTLDEIENIKKLSPRDAKARLAREIVTMHHTEQAAKEAEAEFQKVFVSGEFPSDVPTAKIKKAKLSLVDLLYETGLAGSKSEARRLIEQGGVRVDGEVKTDPKEQVTPQNNMRIQVGKRKFLTINI